MKCEIAPDPPTDDGGDCCPCARIHGSCRVHVKEQGTGGAVIEVVVRGMNCAHSACGVATLYGFMLILTTLSFVACIALLVREVLQSSMGSFLFWRGHKCRSGLASLYLVCSCLACRKNVANSPQRNRW